VSTRILGVKVDKKKIVHVRITHLMISLKVNIGWKFLLSILEFLFDGLEDPDL
jgi:hypothetical protein